MCERAMNFDPVIETVATNKGTGNATLSIHPNLAVEQIKSGIEKALKKDIGSFSMSVPDHFILDIRYTKHLNAFRASHYPGAKAISAHITRFEADDMLDIMRFIMFCV